MGGFCIGFERSGFKTMWANDFDPYVKNTYQHNFPNTKFMYGPIESLRPENLSPVHVVHGGFPCQSFSAAGARSGFDDPKGRGKLFDVMMDKIQELEELPLLLVFENVPNLKIGANGTWFEHIKQRIKATGYWFGEENSLILDARKHAGLPQRRERLFMIAVRKDVADFNPFNFFRETNEIQSLQELLMSLESESDAKFMDAESKYHEEMWLEGIEKKGLTESYQLIQYRKYRPRIIEPGICPTLTQNMGAGGHNVPFYLDKKKKLFRKLSVKQCLALQGFSVDYTFPDEMSDGAKFRMIGNAVSPLVSEMIAEKIKVFLNGVGDDLKLAV